MTVGRAWVLVALAALTPRGAFAQFINSPGGQGAGASVGPDYAPPANLDLGVPLYSTNPASGGLFLAGGYAMYQQTNPLTDQLVAVRGFIAVDNSVNGQGTAGQFFGTRNNALDVHQLTGPSTYQPGFTVEGGWKFTDGTALTVSYLWLAEAQYRAVATLAAPNLQIRTDQTDSFLTAFVFNFPAQFSGPNFKIQNNLIGGNPNPQALFGIWNGASAMTESFLQRAQQLEATYRIPFYDTECYRISGLIGPRFFWIWERYAWRTTDIGSDAQFGQMIETPQWTALYTNIVSNAMYGVKAGFSQEWYLGAGFAAMLDIQGATFLDIVREIAKYQLGSTSDGFVANKRSVRQYYVVPEFQGTASVMWYPWEGVQLKLGYDVFGFFNTISSPRPVSFDYSGLNPNYERTFRLFDGFQASVAIIF
jgi:hypothetical protein